MLAFLHDAAATVSRCPWWRHRSLQALPLHASYCSPTRAYDSSVPMEKRTWKPRAWMPATAHDPWQLRLHACHGKEEIGNLGIMGKLPRLAWWCSRMMWCSIIAGCWLLCSVTFRIICRLDHLPGSINATNLCQSQTASAMELASSVVPFICRQTHKILTESCNNLSKLIPWQPSKMYHAQIHGWKWPDSTWIKSVGFSNQTCSKQKWGLSRFNTKQGWE